MVRHIVLFKFSESASQTAIESVKQELAALKDKVPGILNFKGGDYSSPEGLNHGFNYGFTMDFESVSARDAYLPHPEHIRVVEKLRLLVDGELQDNGLVFDFEI